MAVSRLRWAGYVYTCFECWPFVKLDCEQRQDFDPFSISEFISAQVWRLHYRVMCMCMSWCQGFLYWCFMSCNVWVTLSAGISIFFWKASSDALIAMQCIWMWALTQVYLIEIILHYPSQVQSQGEIKYFCSLRDRTGSACLRGSHSASAPQRRTH